MMKELLRLDLHEEARKFLIGFYEGVENSTNQVDIDVPPPSTVIIEEIVEPIPPPLPKEIPKAPKPGRNMDGQETQQPGRNRDGQETKPPGRNMDDQENCAVPGHSTDGQVNELAQEVEVDVEALEWSRLLDSLRECLRQSTSQEEKEYTLLRKFKSMYMSNPASRPDEAKQIKQKVRDRLAELDMLITYRKDLVSRRKREEEGSVGWTSQLKRHASAVFYWKKRRRQKSRKLDEHEPSSSKPAFRRYSLNASVNKERRKGRTTETKFRGASSAGLQEYANPRSAPIGAHIRTIQSTPTRTSDTDGKKV